MEYNLSEAEAQAVYDALRGDVNLGTLQKTKKLLEAQKLPHAVAEINQRLRMFEGSGEKNPGLLRLFNPQHDLLNETTKSDPSDPRQQDLLAVGGVDDTPAAPSGVSIEWDENTPKPRPEPGQLIVQPSGMACSIVDVLGYDAEQQGFRVVDTDGWDGDVFAYGQRDALQWRVCSQRLEYKGGSDFADEPLGSLAAIAADLRAWAGELLSEAPAFATADEYHDNAAEVLPLLVLTNPAQNPEYLRGIVMDELSGAEDNAHALARLMIQHADVADANADSTTEGSTLDVSGLSDEDQQNVAILGGGDHEDDDARERAGIASDGDASGLHEAEDDAGATREHEATEGTVAEEGYSAGTEQAVDTVDRPASAQRKRNASQNGVGKVATTKAPKGKKGGKGTK